MIKKKSYTMYTNDTYVHLITQNILIHYNINNNFSLKPRSAKTHSILISTDKYLEINSIAYTSYGQLAAHKLF